MKSLSQLKEQMRKEFDEKFKVGYQWSDDEFVDISKWGEIKSFLDTQLDILMIEVKECVGKDRVHSACLGGMCGHQKPYDEKSLMHGLYLGAAQLEIQILENLSAFEKSEV